MFDLYLPMFVLFGVALATAGGMWLGATYLGPKNPTPEKLMPYECGNDSEGARHKRVTAKYFLVAILFVVFDIEVVFLYPWATLFKGLGWVGFGTMSAFIAALVVALIYCWKKGALEWES